MPRRRRVVYSVNVDSPVRDCRQKRAPHPSCRVRAPSPRAAPSSPRRSGVSRRAYRSRQAAERRSTPRAGTCERESGESVGVSVDELCHSPSLHARSQPVSARPRSPLSFARPLSRPPGAHTRARGSVCLSARLSGRRRTWQGLGRTPRKPTTPARSRRTTGQMVATKRRIRCGWPFYSTCAREKCGERPRETSTLDHCGESYDSDAVFEPGPRERAKRGLSDVLSHGAPASSAPGRAPSGPIAPHPAKRAEVQARALEGYTVIATQKRLLHAFPGPLLHAAPPGTPVAASAAPWRCPSYRCLRTSNAHMLRAPT